MKIEVGMYVRLDRNQGIAKIDDFEEEYNIFSLDKCIYDEWGDSDFKLDKRDVIKASYNIIDLIEVGDYVNGYKVVQVSKSIEGRKYITTEAYHKINYGNVFENEIKSIVTKEQFEAVEYKVEE